MFESFGNIEPANKHIFRLFVVGSLLKGGSGWIAFSFLNDRFSYFQRGWCQRISALVHEVGHQLGLKHSGKGSEEYGDESCTMG